MRFPYREFSRGQFAPIVNLEVWGGGRWIEVEAYIDSGATYSIFHADTAGILGIAYANGKKIMIRVGDGNLISVYLNKLPVKFAEHRFNAAVGFSKDLGVGFNLLGRVDFFDRFRICFNDKEKFLETTYL
ncbi:MAG: hypothetical protein A3D87_03635 [Omnitrophica WOR_2 bacterium RIFCSPHIGHO2_02_FULL_50_17]|nr:MAG: hypothetical protein A3D87_03635 [Omnitrophica WOR_2 bacterium RIFCSPHIGHO2_02_FULL_50_17]